MNILLSKIDEYDQFPALVLGLDGWILKSVPAETRSQFLRTYQKALQIAFHPDRVQDEDAKAGRERFLQVIGEAVTYLSENAINYELATDNVPTKKNPLVSLQRGMEAREVLVAQKIQEINELLSRIRIMEVNVQSAKGDRAAAIKAMNSAQYSAQILRGWENTHVKDLIPIKTQHLNFRGEILGMEELADRIYASQQLYVKSTQALRIERGRFNGSIILGAASNLHLSEFLSAESLWAEIQRERFPEMMKNAHKGRLSRFLLPFVAPNTALILDTEPLTAVIVSSIESKERTRLALFEKQLKMAHRQNKILKSDKAKLEREKKALEKKLNPKTEQKR